MEKLPVIFVSCNADRLQSPESGQTGPARLIWGKHYRSVVLLSTNRTGDGCALRDLKSSNAGVERIHSMLEAEGFTISVDEPSEGDRSGLLESFLFEQPDDIVELSLSTGMPEDAYRQVGVSLEGLREQGVLIICVDDKPDDCAVSLHNQHLRNLIDGWIHDQQWSSAASFKGSNTAPEPEKRLTDPTVCLLKAAFSLGGSQSPQRMFSSGMNSSAQALSGFGWMR